MDYNPYDHYATDDSFDLYDDPIPDPEDFDLVACPICDAVSNPMGQLGSLDWYCCRRCGMQFNQVIS